MLFNTYDPFRSPLLNETHRGLDYDIVRNEDGVTLHIDIPGVDPSTVDLTVDGRSLRLEANRETSVPEGAKVVSRRRRSGNVKQTFQLGQQLDADRLTADYEHGVLVVSIPVAESAKPRKVAVGAAANAAIETSSEAA